MAKEPFDIMKKEIEPTVEEMELQKMHGRKKEYILENLDRFMNQRKTYEHKWREGEKMARGQSIGTYVRTQSKVTLPLVHNAIRSVASRLRDVEWGGRDNFDIYGRKLKLGEEGVAIKEYIKYQLGHIGIHAKNFYNIFYKFCHALCTYGKAYLKITWQFTEGKKKVRIWKSKASKDDLGKVKNISYNPVNETIDTTLYDGLCIEHVSIFDLYADAEIPDIEDQPVLIHRKIEDWNYIQRNIDAGVYKYATEEDKEKFRIGKLNYDRKEYVKNLIRRDKDILETTKERGNRYELLEAHYYDYDGDGKYYITTLLCGADDCKVIQDDEYPYMHGMGVFVDADFEPDIHSFYKPGIPELCRENAIEAQDNRRKINDATLFSLNNMWMMDTAGGKVPKFLFSEPNKVIPVMRWPGLKDIRPDPSIIQMGISAEKLSVETIRETAMSPSAFQGLPTRYGTTATEASQILNQAGVSIVDVAKHIEEHCINRMLRMVYMLDRQFIIKEQVIMVLGEDGAAYPEKLKPWEMREDIEFIATGSLHMENRMVKLQFLNNLLSQAKEMGEIVKVANIIAEVLKLADFQNVEHFVNLDPIQDSVDAATENMMVLQGQDITVRKKDAHIEHLMTHGALMKAVKDKFVKEELARHIKKHEMIYEQITKEMMAAQAQQGGGPAKVGQNHQPRTAIGVNRQTEKNGKPQGGKA